MTTPDLQSASAASDSASTSSSGAATDDPFAPSTRALRVFAGIGLLLLPVVFVVFVFIALNQAYSGDGASGPLVGVAPWAMGLSAIVGLLALCLSGDTVSHAERRGAVRLQYVLALAGPVLAAVDFA